MLIISSLSDAAAFKEAFEKAQKENAPLYAKEKKEEEEKAAEEKAAEEKKE